MFFRTFTIVATTIGILISCNVRAPADGTDNPVNSDSKFALEFNGTTDHIVIENMPKSIGVNSTTTAWIYKTRPATTQQWVVGMGARQNLIVQGDGRVAIANYLAKGRPDGELDPGYWCSVADTGQIPLNKWVHYAGVFETDNETTILRLYRNGDLISEQTFNYAVNGNPGCDGFIGGVHTGNKSPECNFTSPQRFVGQLDELSMWERSLSSSEIKDVMKRKLNHNDEGLIGYWPFEEGIGTLSIDRSKYTNHANLMYGAKWIKLH